jgi:hypothetical protein
MALIVTLSNQSICYAAGVWRWYFVGVSIRVPMPLGFVTSNSAGSAPAPEVEHPDGVSRTGDNRGWYPILGNACFVVWRRA